MSTEMDYLVVNDFLYKKEDQKDWDDKKKWERLFEMD
jgi:carbamoyltransferase